MPLDHSVLGATFEDQITPIAPAHADFTDDAVRTDALSVATADYKVVFLAFPFEAYGTAARQDGLMGRVLGSSGTSTGNATSRRSGPATAGPDARFAAPL